MQIPQLAMQQKKIYLRRLLSQILHYRTQKYKLIIYYHRENQKNKYLVIF